jgi:hypothetical protein
MSKCQCSVCKQNAKFYEFRDLLPETSKVEFTKWYSEIFDTLEEAETELAMQEYHKKNPCYRQNKSDKPARIPIGASLPTTQLNLGQLIELLELVPDHTLPVKFQNYPGSSTLNLSSWRGSYSELAIEWDFDLFESSTSVNEFLFNLKESINKSFPGWKGDEFIMFEQTPLWVASYGVSAGFMHSINGCETQAVTGINITPTLVEICSAITKN